MLTHTDIYQLIALIDQRINAQINAIIHDDAFQALEASWRNLYQLIHQIHKNLFLLLLKINVICNEIFGKSVEPKAFPK